MTGGASRRRLTSAALLLSGSGCAAQQISPAPPARPAIEATVQVLGTSARNSGAPRLWSVGRETLGRPPADALRNVNGSPRITDPALYARFLADHAASLEAAAGERRLGLNPNFVAALVAKESGFDPRATSWVPAYGIAQITHIADLDLREIAAKAPAFRWMAPEVESWPRMTVVHDPAASKARTDSLLANGTITPRAEYLFNPRTALRASTFWLRVLATIWSEDEWPGMHGALARRQLGAGADGKIAESDLLALVIVSYNQGHPYVADLLRKHGRDWTKHLNEESTDYLERILVYTDLFQRAL
jgi:hypothetical protein